MGVTIGYEHLVVGFHVVVELTDNASGDVAALDGLAVVILVECRRSGAEHRTNIYINDRRIAVVRRIVDTEERAKVVGRTHDGAKV